MPTKPLKKGATYDDLVRVPENFVAEMFDGELYASPRPAFPHARAAAVLLGKLGGSFDFGDGPGGWLIYIEPELHFGDDVLVPDLAGWKRARLPSLPTDAFLTLSPDWICEVLSPKTEYLHRNKKLRIYARESIGHAWLVDPLRQSLEVLALESARFEKIEEHHGPACVRARPFDAVELELQALWS
jgi:Uma2 family endonuclease